MNLDQLLQQLLEIQKDVISARAKIMDGWRSELQRPSYLASAENLAAYIGLRRWDLRDIQRQLAPLALSSLGRSESHVEASLNGVIHGLRMRLGQEVDPAEFSGLGDEIRHLQEHYHQNTRELLGDPPDTRQTRIMVTLPLDAAGDPSMIRNLMAQGMDIARINLAHDNKDAWNAMVANIRKAEKATGRPCHILMDLAGAKLRTGGLSPLPPAIHIKVKRDVRGTVLQPAGVILDGVRIGRAAGRDGQGRRTPVRLAVDPEWLKRLSPGDAVDFVDLTGKHRTLQLQKWIGAEAMLAYCHSNAYVEPGTVLVYRPRQRPRKPLRCPIGPMTPPTAKLIVHKGDQLRLSGSGTLGQPARFDALGNLEACATIPCQEDGVFAFLNPGERVFIDDGAIQAEVTDAGPKHAMLRIVRTREDGNRIRAEKGLNFPDSNLRLPPLSEKDLRDLDMVVAHADMVGFSFVQQASDIDALVQALDERTARPIGIVAKIETQRAVENLPEIIVRGASQRPFGVMIARGDLAVELGYERLAEIQEELLWVCEAAHVPVIWATQVLENLIKKGTPSRAEVTDAAMSMRAECVMLNKGPHILNGIKLLEEVIQRMQAHQDKKISMLRALHW